MVKNKTKKDDKDINGLLIPAGALLGIGIGMAVDATAVGVLIGLGTGFLAMFIAKKFEKKKK